MIPTRLLECRDCGAIAMDRSQRSCPVCDYSGDHVDVRNFDGDVEKKSRPWHHRFDVEDLL